MRRALCLVLVGLTLFCTGCVKAILRGAGGEELVLMTESRYGALEQFMEHKIKAAPSPSNSDLYYLCSAYSKVKNYDKLFTATDTLQRRIDQGDRFITMMGRPVCDLTPYPRIFRAQAFIEFGNYARAVKEAERAFRLARSTHTLDYTTVNWEARTTLGLAYALNGNRREATKLALEGKKMATNFFGHEGSPRYQFPLAKVFVALGDYESAQELIRYSKRHSMVVKALAIFTGDTVAGDLFTNIDLPNNYMMGKLMLETGEVEKAKKGFDALLNIPQTAENSEIYWMLLSDRGRIAEMEQDRGRAIELYGRAIHVIEEQRSTINTEANKIGFVGDKQDVYRRMVSLLCAQGRHAEAFEYVERAKARALVDMLASRKGFATAGAGPGDANALIANLDIAEHEATVQSEITTTDGEKNRRAVVIKLKEEIRTVDPELASLVTVTPPGIADIQQLLAADETLVEYFGSDKTFFVFIVNHNGIRALKLTVDGLKEKITTFRELIMRPQSHRFKAYGKDLYRQLIQPVKEIITSRNLTIVPHGALHYVPFNALYGDNAYLIDEYNVRTLPSASVMTFLQDRREGYAGTILALGNPDLGSSTYDLPWAEREAVVITSGQRRSAVLTGSKATETAVKRLGGQFRYIHFATHGTFDAERPLSSGLLLAKDRENDGRLTVGELYDLHLPADLVTLSACETALGTVASGDDVVGFTRGFLYAGASSIVSSLWKVDDRATSILMQEFYRSLQTSDKRSALRTAQLTVKNNYNAHPYYWAAFQITGSAQ